MRARGRVNWMIVLLTAVAVAIFGLLATSGDTANSAAGKFLRALGKGDVTTLADLSYFSPEQGRSQTEADWSRTVKLGKHYIFAWRIVGDTRPAPDRSLVRIAVTKDVSSESSYEENFSLSMVKVKGKWLVDVRAMSRDMYPALPR